MKDIFDNRRKSLLYDISKIIDLQRKYLLAVTQH